MYTCDYLRYFELLAYPLLFVVCVCFNCDDCVKHGSK